MQKTRKKAAAVQTAAQYEAISSGVRDQILQVVVNQAPPEQDGAGVSIREIGAQLGRKPASLYRHIEELVEAGLLIEAGAEASGGRDATTYTAAGSVIELASPAGDRAALEALCRYIERTATHAGREHAAATRRHATSPAGAKDHAMLSMFGWLDASQRKALHEHLIDISRIFQTAHRRAGTKLIAASLFIRPVLLPGGETAQEP